MFLQNRDLFINIARHFCPHRKAANNLLEGSFCISAVRWIRNLPYLRIETLTVRKVWIQRHRREVALERLKLWVHAPYVISRQLLVKVK